LMIFPFMWTKDWNDEKEGFKLKKRVGANSPKCRKMLVLYDLSSLYIHAYLQCTV
jgi:hypothetical protein